eukprot:565700-Pleurochrysis_carterae.AAC.1
MRCATQSHPFPHRLCLRSPPPSALLLMTSFPLHPLHSRPPRHSRALLTVIHSDTSRFDYLGTL